MSKVKVTAKFQILDLLDQLVNENTNHAIGRTIEEEARKMIAEGQSPVKGYGRFERYKDRKKYPGDQKPARPVNLNLTGQMMRLFGYRLKGKAVEVGFIKRGPHGDLPEYHQEGTEHMAQRRLTPGEGEEWAVSIMRRIRDLYEKRLEKFIRQTNKKA